MIETTMLINRGITCLVLLLITVSTGYALYRRGEPYGNLLFTVHKVATVVLVVLASGIIIKFFRSTGGEVFSIMATAAAVVGILSLLVSGGLMSLGKMHIPMRLVHSLGALLFTSGITMLGIAVLKSLQAAL